MKIPLYRFLAVLFLKFPQVAFILHLNNLDKTKPWKNNFQNLCIWDCVHYSNLSETLVPREFFPLFPLISKIFYSLGIHPNNAVVITSIIFTLISSLLLLELGSLLFKNHQSFLGYGYPSWMLVIAVSIFPQSHYWIYGYSEPLFMSLLVFLLISTFKNNYILASLMAGLISITRPQGIWVMGLYSLLLVYIFRKNKVSKKNLLLSWSLTFTPLFLFFIWNYIEYSNPIYFLTAQKGYGRSFSLMQGLKSHIPFLEHSYLYLILGIASSIQFFKSNNNVHKYFLGILTLIMVELPLFIGGYMSYPRFQSVNLGIFIFLTSLFLKKNWLFLGYILWSLTYLIKGSHQWYLGHHIY